MQEETSCSVESTISGIFKSVQKFRLLGYQVLRPAPTSALAPTAPRFARFRIWK